MLQRETNVITPESGTQRARPTTPDRGAPVVDAITPEFGTQQGRATVPDRTVANSQPTGAPVRGMPAAGPIGQQTEAIGATGGTTLPPGSRTEVLPEGGSSMPGRSGLSRMDFPAVNGHASAPSVPMPLGPAPVPDALGLLRALRHRWLVALSAGLACAVAAATLTWYVLPTTLSLVTATAWVHLRQAQDQRVLWNPGGSFDWGTFKQTQCRFMRSREVLTRALADPAVESLSVSKMPLASAVSWLEQNIKINPGDSEIVEISMSGDKPAQVTILVNAVADAYEKMYTDIEKTKKENWLNEMEQEEKRLTDAIQDNMAAVAVEKGLAGGNKDEMLHELELTRLRTALQNLLEVEKRLSRARMAQVNEQKYKKTGTTPKAAPQDQVPPHLMEEALDKDPAVQKLRTRKANLEATIEQYKRNMNIDSPLVKKGLKGYEEDLVQVEKDLKGRENALRPRILAGLRSTNLPVVVDTAPSDYKQLIEELEAEKKLAEEDLDQAKAAVRKFYGKASNKIEILVAAAESKKESLKTVSTTIHAFKLEDKNPPRVTVTQRAVEPHPSDAHRQTKTIFLAGLSAFLFIGFCTAWIEFRSQRIYAADDVIHGLGLRLLGTVPALPDRIRRHPAQLEHIADTRLRSSVTESFEGIRTMIMHEARHTPLRVVMVASAISGEGKTTMSSQLAYSLAHAGLRTLLIDCDLVHPVQSELFNVSLTPGLCEVLRGEVDYSSAIVETEAPGLFLLPAGHYDRQVSQVLAKGWIQNLFDALRAQFDFIIIDSCPVLSVANTLLIGQHVDGVVLSVLRGKSQVPRVHATYHRLAALGIRVIGTIFNKARNEAYGYYGYYGHEPKSKPRNSDPEKTIQQ